MIVVVLAALLGGIVACGGVLLQHAMVSRKRDDATINERLV